MNARAAALLVVVCAFTACRPQHGNASGQAEAATIAARDTRFRERLALAETARPNEALARWIMPRNLTEISGLALAGDGRLFAHDDNDARIFVFEPRRGEMLKSFFVGNPTLHGDFEGITVVGETVYLIDSNGILLQFDEGDDGAHVPYKTHDTKLGHECEFEGIAFEAATSSLLLPCKHVYQKKLKDELVIYRLKLSADVADSARLTMLTVPVAQVVGSNGWTAVHPSEITIDPITGNYLLILARVKGLVEITPAGEVVRSGPLPGQHAQPEGLALTHDSVLIVGDEAASRSPAAITLYHWPAAATKAGSR